MTKRPRSDINYVTLVTEDGTIYQAGTETASSVEITGDALTALQAIDVDASTIITRLNTLITAIGAAGDAADAATVIGQLKQIVINTAA